VWDELPQLLDRAAAVAAVLAELEVHRNEPVLITLPEGPGFVESFAGVVDQEALPLPAGPLLSASKLVAAAAATRPGWCWPRWVSYPRRPSRHRTDNADQWVTRTVGSRAAAALSPVRLVTAVPPWRCVPRCAAGVIVGDAAPMKIALVQSICQRDHGE